MNSLMWFLDEFTDRMFSRCSAQTFILFPSSQRLIIWKLKQWELKRCWKPETIELFSGITLYWNVLVDSYNVSEPNKNVVVLNSHFWFQKVSNKTVGGINILNNLNILLMQLK